MHSRNAGLQRLRSITKRVGVATTVLTGIFAGLAAAGNSGHHARKTAAREPAPRTRAVRTIGVPAPPSLPPLRSDGSQSDQSGSQSPPPVSPQPAPITPQPPPAVTQSPPVTSSGGS
jgi:hypothetical protein